MCNIFLKPLLHPLNGRSLFHYIEQIVRGVQSNVFYPLNKQLTIQWYLSMYRTNKNNCNRLNQPKSMTSSANIMLCVSLLYISKRNVFPLRIGLNIMLYIFQREIYSHLNLGLA